MTVEVQTMSKVEDGVKDIIEQSEEALLIRITKDGEPNVAVHYKFKEKGSTLQAYLTALLKDIMGRSNAKAADQANR